MRVTNSVYVLSGSYYGAVGNRDVLGDVYGVLTEKGLILIDCGIPGAGSAMIRETLDYYGIEAPVTHVLITHAHFDHVGSAKEFQEAGAMIVVGRGDVKHCVEGGFGEQPTPFRLSHAFPAFEPDIVIDEDCVIDLNGLSFHFYTTPGHTAGCICIAVELDGKKVLFSGDAVQPSGGQIDAVGLGWQGDTNFSRKDIVESMLKLMELDVDMVLPGHGKVCLRNGSALLRLAAETAFLTLR